MAEPRNLLFLICDQMQRQALDIYGGPVATRAWRSLADRGVIFDRCYCASPLCLPTRAAMMTGRWPHAHGSLSFGEGYDTMHSGEELLIDQLQASGYHVGYDGIWHIRRQPGEDRRDCYPYFCERRFPYDGHQRMTVAQGVSGDAIVKVRTPADTGEEEWTFSAPIPSVWTDPIEQHPDMQAARAIADFILAAPADRPFAAWCSIGAPHPPLTVPQQFSHLFRASDMIPPPGFGTDTDGKPLAVTEHAPGFQAVRDWDWARWAPAIAAYYSYAAFADSCMSLVIDALRDSRRAADTIVVAVADHGEMLGAHNLYQKGVMYDRACRIPCVLAGPGLAPGRYAGVASQVDLAPTLLELLGLAPLSRAQGVSLVAPINGDEAAAPAYRFVEFNGHVRGGVKMRAAVSRQFKYAWFPGDVDQLFDLENDPDELVDLAADPAYASTVACLRSELTAWMDRTEDFCPSPSMAGTRT